MACVRQRHPVGRRRHRLDLLEDVQAVGLVVDHPDDAACLALDAAQPVEQLAAVLGVGMPEMSGVDGLVAHTRG
jgi:hypothetical protein